MKALIIEDEEIAAERLSSMISQSGKAIKIIDQFDTVRDTVNFLTESKNDVDIMFCDIQLADGLSFSIFDKLHITTPVIFITAFDEYMLKAFKVNSVDYLLKPVRQAELNIALDKYFNLHHQNQHLDLSRIKEYFGQPEAAYKERFLARSGKKFYNKEVTEITYFSTDKKIVYLHDQDGSGRYMTDHTLDELVTELLNPKKFLRINRKHIVNIEAIKLIKPYPGQRLILELKSGQADDLVVSREKVAGFKEWFN